MKFVILTDTHFVPRGRKLYGLDPVERLAVAVETNNATHRDISFVIVTGDLAHWGEQAAYASLAGVLGALDAPTVLMMGNHDKREAFRSEFAGADRDANGFVQGVHIFDAAAIVTLDTLNEETPDHPRVTFQEHTSPRITPSSISTVATSSSTSARFSTTARPSRFTTPGHSSRSRSVNWSKLQPRASVLIVSEPKL